MARVIVALSGGVDSAVAASLLLDAGHRVEALFMSNWEEDDDGYCTSAADFQDARRVCDELGIALHKASFAREYRERVFAHFLAELEAGRTPEPGRALQPRGQVRRRARLCEAAWRGALRHRSLRPDQFLGAAAARRRPSKRTRATSCIRSTRAQLAGMRVPDRQACASPKCVPSRGSAAFPSRTSAIRRASASSASGPSAVSSGPGCRDGRGRSRRPTARSSAGIAASNATRLDSAADWVSAACEAAATSRGSSRRRTSRAIRSSSFRGAPIRRCSARACARPCRTGLPARRPARLSRVRPGFAIGSRTSPARS